MWVDHSTTIHHLLIVSALNRLRNGEKRSWPSSDVTLIWKWREQRIAFNLLYVHSRLLLELKEAGVCSVTLESLQYMDLFLHCGGIFHSRLNRICHHRTQGNCVFNLRLLEGWSSQVWRKWLPGVGGGYFSFIDPMQQEGAALQRRMESHLHTNWTHNRESFRSDASCPIYAKRNLCHLVLLGLR